MKPLPGLSSPMPDCPAHALPRCMEATLEIPNRVGCYSATALPPTNSRRELAPTTTPLASPNLRETIFPLREYRIAANNDRCFALSGRSKPNSKLSALATNRHPVQARHRQETSARKPLPTFLETFRWQEQQPHFELACHEAQSQRQVMPPLVANRAASILLRLRQGRAPTAPVRHLLMRSSD